VSASLYSTLVRTLCGADSGPGKVVLWQDKMEERTFLLFALAAWGLVVTILHPCFVPNRTGMRYISSNRAEAKGTP
jgi:hypothetical protein